MESTMNGIVAGLGLIAVVMTFYNCGTAHPDTAARRSIVCAIRCEPEQLLTVHERTCVCTVKHVEVP